MHRLLPLVAALALCVAGPAAARPQGAIMPGSPVGPGCMTALPVPEPPEGGPEFTLIQLPSGCEVFAGVVVLVESPTRPPEDPLNWSDVVVFYSPGALPLPGMTATLVAMVSDPGENGISDADLAPLGVPITTSFIVSQPTFYLPENPLEAHNIYLAVGPGGEIQYDFQSDPAEPPTPAANASWGNVKSIYR